MSRDDSEEPLEALAAALDDLVREAVREDLARERGDVHACRLALEDVPEGLEVGVPPPHDRMAKLEGRDIRLLNPLRRQNSTIRGIKAHRRADEHGPCIRSHNQCTSCVRNLADDCTYRGLWAQEGCTYHASAGSVPRFLGSSPARCTFLRSV